MREILGAVAAAVLGASVARPGRLEQSTGILIGARHDARAIRAGKLSTPSRAKTRAAARRSALRPPRP